MNVMESREPSAGTDPLAGEIIDCDVHPVVLDGFKPIYPYMPKAWMERFEAKNVGMGLAALPPRNAVPNGGNAIRPDSRTPDGRPGGSCPKHMRKDLIESHGIRHAVLNCLQTGALAVALAGPEESAVLCRAYNDYFLDQWDLADSDDLRYAMVVPSQRPDRAVEEINRLGKVKGIAAVFMPLLNIPMGNLHYHPIYQAACDNGLPILLHVTGTENVYHGPPVIAGGWPESFAERYVALSQVGESALISLILSGTLERYPDMKVLFVEFGCSWALPLLWRMDKCWRGVRFDMPWVKRSPFDYVSDHVKWSTQPLDEPADPNHLRQMIDMMGDHLFCFATDYPHWDNDMPGQSLRMLPEESRRKIFIENSKQVLRL